MFKPFWAVGLLLLVSGCVLFPNPSGETLAQSLYAGSANEYDLLPPPPATVFIGSETIYQKNYKMNERLVINNGESMIRVKGFRKHNYIHAKMLLEKEMTLKSKIEKFTIAPKEYPIFGVLDLRGERFFAFLINAKMLFVTDLDGVVQPFLLYHPLSSPENRVVILSDPVSVSPEGAYMTRVMSFREEKIPATDYEIIYEGIKNGKITLFYKYAVPGTDGGKGSFDTYTYPLNTTMISLKGTLFRVLHANNEKIELLPIQN